MVERWKPNVTVAAVVEQNGRFLMVEEHTPEGVRLNNPAGHLDPGESPMQACIRETLEETAYPLEPTGLVGVYLSRVQKNTAHGLEDITYLRLAFSGRVGDAEKGRSLDAGIIRAIWLTPEEIRASRNQHRSPLVLQCMEDFLAGKRLPLNSIFTDSSVFEPFAPLQKK
jgi:8-oxo-dGTP pyrophosphatase MutT (NUDIX family)